MSAPYDYDAPPPMESQAPQGEGVVRESSTYMTDRDAEKFCQLFADGLRSGIGYARILDFMERQGLDAKMTAKLRVAVLEYGDRLGESFARFGILDAAARKLILVAEEQGALPETFKEQSRIYGTRYNRKKKVVFGLVEPALVFCLGVFYFRNVIGNIMEATFSNDTWGVIGDLFVLSSIQSAIFFLFFGGCMYTWINLPVDSSFREAVGRLWFRVPVLSTPVRTQAVANFARYLRQSVRSGMDIFLSIDLAAEATNSPWFIDSVDEVFAVLEAGYPLDQAMRQMRGLPTDFADYIAIGEETGRLEENLDFLAERYDEKAVEAYARSLAAFVYMTRLLFIVLILIFAVFGGVMDSFFGAF